MLWNQIKIHRLDIRPQLTLLGPVPICDERPLTLTSRRSDLHKETRRGLHPYLSSAQKVAFPCLIVLLYPDSYSLVCLLMKDSALVIKDLKQIITL